MAAAVDDERPRDGGATGEACEEVGVPLPMFSGATPVRRCWGMSGLLSRAYGIYPTEPGVNAD